MRQKKIYAIFFLAFIWMSQGCSSSGAPNTDIGGPKEDPRYSAGSGDFNHCPAIVGSGEEGQACWGGGAHCRADLLLHCDAPSCKCVFDKSQLKAECKDLKQARPSNPGNVGPLEGCGRDQDCRSGLVCSLDNPSGTTPKCLCKPTGPAPPAPPPPPPATTALVLTKICRGTLCDFIDRNPGTANIGLSLTGYTLVLDDPNCRPDPAAARANYCVRGANRADLNGIEVTIEATAQTARSDFRWTFYDQGALDGDPHSTGRVFPLPWGANQRSIAISAGRLETERFTRAQTIEARVTCVSPEEGSCGGGDTQMGLFLRFLDVPN